MNLSQLETQLNADRERLRAHLAGLKNEDGSYKTLDASAEAQIKTLEDAVNQSKARYESAKRVYDLELANNEELKRMNRARTENEPELPDAYDVHEEILASLAYGTPRNLLRGTGKKSSEDMCWAWGQLALAIKGRNPVNAIKALKRQGYNVKALEEGNNANGGFLVPELMEGSIIDLRERYGVFRRNANIYPMGSDIVSRPRRTGGATVYYPGEAGSITASTPTFDQVKLQAVKYATLVYESSEIAEDAVINLGAYVANEIAYAFSVAEDDNGFNGDGTSTYGSVVGIRPKIKGLSGTIANIAGLVVADGNAYSEITLANLEAVVGRLPEYADGESVKWFVHKRFYYEVMVKLALAAGGVTSTEIAGGRRVPMFLGYPVEFAQVMPRTEANSQVFALFGDLARSTTMGVRRGLELAVSEHAAFTTDQIAIRGTQRVAINAHSLGNANSTESLRVPGPIVGGITAAS